MSTITFRADAQTEEDLRLLQEIRGETRTEVIREALHEAARTAKAERMRAQSLALLNDPVDQQAFAEALADMEHLRAW